MSAVVVYLLTTNRQQKSWGRSFYWPYSISIVSLNLPYIYSVNIKLNWYIRHNRGLGDLQDKKPTNKPSLLAIITLRSTHTWIAHLFMTWSKSIVNTSYFQQSLPIEVIGFLTSLFWPTSCYLNLITSSLWSAKTIDLYWILTCRWLATSWVLPHLQIQLFGTGLS